MNAMTRGIALLLGIVAHSSTVGLLAADLPKVPAGFTISRVTAPEMLRHPTMGCLDDRGRLYVCESAGTNRKAAELLADPQDQIVRLEDEDGDGVFDRKVVFADKLVFPQGVLWHEGVVYTCCSPYLWKLEDTNGDGVCDKRTVLVKSFGFSGNAADIHGPFLGPDGRLWWCDGRHGHEIRTDDKGAAGGPDNALAIAPKPEPGLPNPDGKLLTKGKAARIFNCNLDGTDVQTFCGGGMDNPVEVDFWDTGEVIGTANLFHGVPRGDVLVHWVLGGVYPRTDQQDCIAEFPRTVGLLDEIVNYGHVAVSGLCKYRGDQFGKGWDQSVFVTMFNTHKVVRTTLERSGSTFKATATEDFVVFGDPDSHPTDVLEDADGSLLVVDTGGWFRIGCPASQTAKPQIGGAIYRVRKNGSHRLLDPRGEQVVMARLSLGDLIDMQADKRPVVVARAMTELRRRDQRETLHAPGLNDAQRDRLVDLTIQGLLGENILLGRRVFEAALANCKSPDLAERRRAIDYLVRKFSHSNANAFSPKPVWGAFLKALKEEPVDRVLEHVVTHSLMQDRSWVGYPGHSLEGDCPRAIKAQLLAADYLDLQRPPEMQLNRETVLSLLSTSDVELRRVVFDIIASRSGWSEGALKTVTDSLGQSPLSADLAEMIHQFLAARAKDAAVQNLVTEQFQRPKIPRDVLTLLLSVVRDADISQLPTGWVDGLRSAMRADGEIQRIAVSAAGRHPVPELSNDLSAVIDSAQSRSEKPLPLSETQLAAIEIVHVRDRARLTENRLDSLIATTSSGDDPVRQATAARLIADSPLTTDQRLAIVPLIESSNALIAPILIRAFEGCEDADVGLALVRQLTSAGSSLVIPASDLVRAFKSFPQNVQELARPLIAARGVDPAKQAAKLAEFTESTKSGNARVGREIFFSNKALCSRCHRINGQGETIGPDLSMVGAIRQHHELVEAVVEPSASFVRSYRPWVIVTQDGKTHTGVMSAETPTEITLRTADFAETRIKRSDIESVKEADTSIMPAGLDQRLTRTELADLLAFLASLKERK